MKREREKQIRTWKRSFDPTFNPEDPRYPQRYNLTVKQKDWLRNVWTWASTNLLEMPKPCIPSAVPCYNERQGFFFVEAIKPEWNHIEGVGETMRLLGQNNYNRPDNFVPISARNHTGKGMSILDYDEGEFVVHPDTFWALKSYGMWKKNGANPDLNPIRLVHQDRIESTGSGEHYHDTSYDSFFIDLAKRVIQGYMFTHGFDEFPK